MSDKFAPTPEGCAEAVKFLKEQGQTPIGQEDGWSTIARANMLWNEIHKDELEKS